MHYPRISLFLTILIIAFCLPGAASAATYVFVPSKTEISFKVKNLFLSVKGDLKLRHGHCTVSVPEKKMTSALIVLDATTIATDDEERDKSLHSRKFFYTEKYPSIRFEGSQTRIVDQRADVKGVLKIKDQTNPVTMHVSLDAPLTSAKQMISGKAQTVINRLDYNIGTDVSDFVLSEDVQITVHFTAMRRDAYYQRRKPGTLLAPLPPSVPER